MKKFIVTFHAPASAMEQMGQMATASAEEQKEAVAPWMEWAERVGSALVDAGSPLMGGQTLTKSGSSPSDKGVVGYSILQAEDMQAAKALLEDHPHLEWVAGCEIEVYETMHGPM